MASVVGDDGKVVGFLSEIVKAALPGYFDLLRDSSFYRITASSRKGPGDKRLGAVDKYMQTQVIVPSTSRIRT